MFEPAASMCVFHLCALRPQLGTFGLVDASAPRIHVFYIHVICMSLLPESNDTSSDHFHSSRHLLWQAGPACLCTQKERIRFAVRLQGYVQRFDKCVHHRVRESSFAVADHYVYVRKCIRSAAEGLSRPTCIARTVSTRNRISRIPCLSQTHAMSVIIRFDCYVFASPLTERAERCRSRVSNVKWAAH